MKRILFFGVFLLVIVFLIVGSVYVYRNGLVDLVSWRTAQKTNTTTATALNTTSNLLVPQDTDNYYSVRGIYVAKTQTGAWIQTKKDLQLINIPKDTQFTCLPKEYETQWIDFSLTPDLERLSLKQTSSYDTSNYISLIEKQKTQVVFSQPKPGAKASILWIIGCTK